MNRPARRHVLFAVSVWSSMAALSAQDEPAPPPVDRATAEKMLESATAVEREVAELVGRPFKTAVKKAVMTKDELRKELARMLEKEFGKGKRERLEAWLRGLGLMTGERDVEQTMTDVLLSQIGGFYDPERQQFFMMVESAAYGDLVNRMMIAHELCHALDDQYVDLASLIRPGGQEPTEDQNYVIGGVVEGSATALMFRWMARAMTDRSALEDAAKMAEQQKDQMEVLLAAPPYFTLLAANYMVGQHFMTKGKGMSALMSGAADGNVVTEVAKAMPRSSEQLLHPDKYWDAQKRDEPVLLAEDAAVATVLTERTGLVVLERNTLGELVCALVGGPVAKKLNAALMARADYWTNKAAKGWGGDRMFLLGKAAVTSGTAVADPGIVWVTAWDTEEDRQEFTAAVQKHRGEEPGFALVERGKVAVFAFGSAKQLGEAGLAAVLAAATFTQDGKPWAP